MTRAAAVLLALSLCRYANASKSMYLINARMSEYTKAIPLRLDPMKGVVRIYHKLKTAERFGWVNKSMVVWEGLSQKKRRRLQCTRKWALFESWKVRGLDASHDWAYLAAAAQQQPSAAAASGALQAGATTDAAATTPSERSMNGKASATNGHSSSEHNGGVAQLLGGRRLESPRVTARKAKRPPPAVAEYAGWQNLTRSLVPCCQGWQYCA